MMKFLLLINLKWITSTSEQPKRENKANSKGAHIALDLASKTRHACAVRVKEREAYQRFQRSFVTPELEAYDNQFFALNLNWGV